MAVIRTKRALVALPFLLALSSGSMAAAISTSVGAGARPEAAILSDPQPPHLAVDASVDDDSVSIPAVPDVAPGSGESVSEATADAADAGAVPADSRDVECVAKVILHEAGFEPHEGQVAVAQVIRARMKRGGQFPGGACAVVKQPGQFFNVDAYNPPRDTQRWADAVAIARTTLAGEGEDVAPGALFFHAAASRGAWMGARTRVAQIGGHVFFR